MAGPRTTIWKLEPHTRAKHEILRRYLGAWIPILSLGGFPEVLYIDGFAGPGRYLDGETGSPIIALESARDQHIRIDARLVFRFVEEDIERAKVLEKIINAMTLPTNFDWKVYGGYTFEDAFSKIHSSYQARLGRMPPTFAFIDPSGWKGVPFEIVRQILHYPSCEVFVNFMYEEINRFLGHPAKKQADNFNIFFGNSDWKKCTSLSNPRDRNRCLHDLYLEQLMTIGQAEFVRSFEMRNYKDVTDYYLFYATNNIRGFDRMKSAMWKVDESGEFTFSDATNPNQLILFEKLPDYEILQWQVREHFKESVVTVQDVERFVVAKTAFCSTHYKRHVLRPFELANPPVIEIIEAPAGRPKGTFADPKLRIRFI